MKYIYIYVQLCAAIVTNAVPGLLSSPLKKGSSCFYFYRSFIRDRGQHLHCKMCQTKGKKCKMHNFYIFFIGRKS